MRNHFCTPQGAIKRVSDYFLAPSGCPFIYIYQAGAQRTLGAVAPTLLIHPLQASPHHRAQRHGAHPLHPAHPVHDVHHPRPLPYAVCGVCGKSLPSTDSGRPRRYCSDACRQKAYRIRQSLRNPLSPALEGVSLEVSAIRDPVTAHPAISDPAAANEFTWQACTGDSRT